MESSEIALVITIFELADAAWARVVERRNAGAISDADFAALAARRRAAMAAAEAADTVPPAGD